MIILYVLSIIVIVILLFCYFWNPKENLILSNVEISDNYIINNHKQIFQNSIPLQSISYIVLYNSLDIEKEKENWDKKLEGRFKIILDGEPNSFEKINADAIITTKLNPNTRIPHVHLPYFVYSFLQAEIDPEVLIKKDTEIVKKDKFCCFIYSNCKEKHRGVQKRKEFYNLLQKKSGNRVDNLGKCYNIHFQPKKGYLGRWKENIKIYEEYKFVISFENNDLEGYVTEKIWTPMVGRSIPIYWGAPDVGRYFNTKSFIHVLDFQNFDQCIDYILKVDQDQELYEKIVKEPFLNNNVVCPQLFSYLHGGIFYHQLKNILPIRIHQHLRPCQLYTEAIHFYSFSESSNIPNILEIGTESRCFNFTRHLDFSSIIDRELLLSSFLNIKDRDVLILISGQIKEYDMKKISNNFCHLLDHGFDFIIFSQEKLLIIQKNENTLDWIQEKDDNFLKKIPPHLKYITKNL